MTNALPGADNKQHKDVEKDIAGMEHNVLEGF